MRQVRSPRPAAGSDLLAAQKKAALDRGRLVNEHTHPANAQGALWFYLQPPRLRVN